jgi:hypothetical protein
MSRTQKKLLTQNSVRLYSLDLLDLIIETETTKMKLRIENTEANRTVAWHDASRPWAVIADRKWNAIIGRYASKAAAQRKVRQLLKNGEAQ